MSKTFTVADVASHNTGSDLYIIVDQDVYDLTKFQDEHPGGKKSMSSPPLSPASAKTSAGCMSACARASASASSRSFKCAAQSLASELPC